MIFVMSYKISKMSSSNIFELILHLLNDLKPWLYY